MTGIVSWAAGRARMVLAFIAISLVVGGFAMIPVKVNKSLGQRVPYACHTQNIRETYTVFRLFRPQPTRTFTVSPMSFRMPRSVW